MSVYDSERPDDHILPSRKVENRLVRGKRNTRRRRHRIDRYLRRSRLERPRQMVNFSPVELSMMGRIETIPLSRPMVSAAPLTGIDIACWPVTRLKIGRRSVAVGAMAHIVNAIASLSNPHGRQKV